MTDIEWTRGDDGSKGASWNPIRARNLETGGIGHFCVKVSAGCQGCYAEAFQPRFRNRVRYAEQDRDKVEVFLGEKALTAPLRWKKPRRIFVCSMTDLFAPWHPDDWIDKVLAVAALCPRHSFIVLTKRPERMRAYLTSRDAPSAMFRVWRLKGRIRPPRSAMPPWPLPNVWLGVSVEDQATANARIPLLINTPAALHWISGEPLLGPVDISPWLPHLDWVVAGGQSGNGAVPMHPDWARSLRDQCLKARVPFFFKQWGAWAECGPVAAPLMVVLNDGRRCEFSREAMLALDNEKAARGARLMYRVGKKAAGNVLDGAIWDQFPTDQGSGIGDQQ